jgi:hypothetical protein
MQLSHEIPTKTRFATYCFLSLTSVATFQIRPSGDANVAVQLLWITLPFLATLVFHTINDHASDSRRKVVEPSPPSSYTIPLSVSLVLLGQIAIWTRTYLGIPPTFATANGADVQACTLHFAMSFWVLSECEFMCAYWNSRLRDEPFDLVALEASVHPANLDWTFTTCRDCISYRTPCQVYIPPRNGWWSLEALFGLPLDLVYLICFTWVGMVCLLYPIKCFVNPDPNGDTFPIKNEFLGVFFTPRSSFFMWIDVALQRPIRLINRMLFELMVDGVKRARVWWNGRNRRGGE